MDYKTSPRALAQLETLMKEDPDFATTVEEARYREQGAQRERVASETLENVRSRPRAVYWGPNVEPEIR